MAKIGSPKKSTGTTKKRTVHLQVTEAAWNNFKRYAERRGTGLSETGDRLFSILDPDRLPPKKIDRAARHGRPTLGYTAIRAIRDRVKAGHSYRAIAADLGISLGTVQRAVHNRNRTGCTYGGQVPGRHPLPVAMCESIRSLHQQGRSYSQIERATGVAASTAHRVVNRVGAYEFR